MQDKAPLGQSDARQAIHELNRQQMHWEHERQRLEVEAATNPQVRLGRLLMPKGSTRERLFLLAFRTAKTLRREGPGAVFRKASRRLSGRPNVALPTAPSEEPPEWTPAQQGNIPLVHEVLWDAVNAVPVARQYEAGIRYSGMSTGERGPCFLPDSREPLDQESLVKLIAFYLPQYHPIPENDEQWGRGFTEWSNVTRALPQYLGHYQPHLPIDLGFYDLRLQDNQRRQVELAKAYGIDGFAFYYYWFAGKRLLEKPLDAFLADPEIDLPFCLIWANENWTRRWDGHEDDVFLAQVHSPETDVQFIKDIEKYLRHPNYIRVEGKPLLIVYKVQLLPDVEKTVRRWRDYAREAGIGDLYLVASQTMGFEDPRPCGFDAAMQFPPHNEHMKPPYRLDYWVDIGPTVVNKQFDGGLYSYPAIVEDKLKGAPETEYELFETAIPMWDNTARRPSNGWIYSYSTPELYRLWLTALANRAVQRQEPSKRLVFLNAWNEWAEGAHLEPDRRFGYAYLNATRQAKQICQREACGKTYMESVEVPVDPNLVKALSNPPTGATFVYQMGKVGSMSIVEELEHRGIGLPVIHSHMLTDFDRIADNACRQYPNPVDVLFEVKRGRMIREWMAKAEEDVRWNVISLTREPVGRNVSAFFQNIEQVLPNIQGRLDIGDLHADELHELFLHIFNSNAPEHWFDAMMKPVFGVDVYEEPYSHERGFQIQETHQSRVMVIRMEDLSRSVEPAMREFLRVSDFRARRANTAEQKYYGHVVRLFKQRPLPEWYVEKMYDTRYARHFYSDAEIGRLRKKWLKDSG